MFCASPALHQSRGQFLSAHVEPLDSVLNRLRTEVGDIEFGYRAQGLFACALRRIGVRVLAINHQGHPDIVANLNGRVARFEVEIAPASERYHTIKGDDLVSIRPVHESEAGFLAILDSAHPIRWAVIEHSRIQNRLGRWPLSTLHGIADADLSKQCTEAFCEILSVNSRKLQALTFHLLCTRAMRGESV